jgi:hypothetical protein
MAAPITNFDRRGSHFGYDELVTSPPVFRIESFRFFSEFPVMPSFRLYVAASMAVLLIVFSAQGSGEKDKKPEQPEKKSGE